MKTCSRCGCEKPLSDFSTYTYDKTKPRAACKACDRGRWAENGAKKRREKQQAEAEAAAKKSPPRHPWELLGIEYRSHVVRDPYSMAARYDK